MLRLCVGFKDLLLHGVCWGCSSVVQNEGLRFIIWFSTFWHGFCVFVNGFVMM
ncbi:hypothetical protein HanHA300_Chr02g0071691 [Helianthus annuus]|nr:hypothetical protein HanHA300_Chr02g0071691 [Helianthus annuus]